MFMFIVVLESWALSICMFSCLLHSGKILFLLFCFFAFLFARFDILLPAISPTSGISSLSQGSRTNEEINKSTNQELRREFEWRELKIDESFLYFSEKL